MRKRSLGGLLDFDYVDKLPESLQKWHAKFVKEYYHASFDKRSTPLHSPAQVEELKTKKEAVQSDVFTQGKFHIPKSEKPE